MPQPGPAAEPTLLPELLGYLNFSSGTPDTQFLRNLNALVAAQKLDGEDTLPRQVGELLAERLEQLAGTSPAFAEIEQARAAIRLACFELPAAYRAFHHDLLFHQPDAQLWNAFFLARACEAILAQGPPWDETARIIPGAIARLNDFVGHRPVAVLHSTQRMEPYPHEWVRPVPLYVRDAGTCAGRYQPLVAGALEILRTTDPALLRAAQFDPALVDELAFDPRAYDFDHPANKRPNYHFGQWDPQHLDDEGRYRRFVVQQVTLEVLLERVEQPGELPPEELLWEASAVLAGTILMASGTSGSGPDAYDSTTTLGTLLPRIAIYRDTFYTNLVAARTGVQGERLRTEAQTGKQPLAGARQHLNQQLARRRAAQLAHVHLAKLYARMDYPAAALRQAHIVPVASARMICEIECRLAAGHAANSARRFEQANELLQEIEAFLQRGIECGALVDPWNILGFQGQFSLFPSPENSVADHRVEQLVELMNQIVGLYSRLWSEAAARDQPKLAEALSRRLKKLTDWWDRFAPTSVESIESFSGREAYDSIREVAGALAAFHRAGGAAGDIAFWRKRVAQFNSPKAYGLAVAALLEQPDLVAALALLMQWLSQAGLIRLAQGEYSFHVLATRWLATVCDCSPQGALPNLSADERRGLVRRFFELAEANAEDFWQVPALELTPMAGSHEPGSRKPVEAEEDDEDVYGAAYDNMVYVDSTADGNEADMLEAGGAVTDFELDAEARRLAEQLEFLRTIAHLWKRAALAGLGNAELRLPADVLVSWHEQAAAHEGDLLALLEQVDARRIPAPSATRDSLLEFDRRSSVKEALAERIVAATVETADAARLLQAGLPADARTAPDDERAANPLDEVLRAMYDGDSAAIRQQWQALLQELRAAQFLYVPLSKGGRPAALARARSLQQSIRHLMRGLPRLGLLRETCQLLETVRLAEAANPAGSGAISEFDRLFATGYEAIVETLVSVSEGWQSSADAPDKRDHDLVECLEQATEPLLRQWLAHSRTLRLSVLERIGNEKTWQAVVSFVERYGRELFTQRFLHLGNLRAIQAQGVSAWLAQLEEQPPDEELMLLGELGNKLPRADAVKHLSLVIEAVVENYAEYRDYNNTTTQSDQGDLLYTLLDFLRLRVHYDRVAWHLKPLLAAHAILVRGGHDGAAESWRRALAERTAELADSLEQRCRELSKKYAMRLPTVVDRLNERFVRPLTVDRVRALVKPAMDEARVAAAAGAQPNPASFLLLEQEADELAHEPTGVGLDTPGWLQSLEQEVDAQRTWRLDAERAFQAPPTSAQVPLTLEEVYEQLTGWEIPT